MAGDKLELATNVPETISLAFPTGMEVTSPYTGDQVLFTLVDGRKWYCAPFVADKIYALGIGEREAFSVCKRERKEGNRKFVEYEIERGNGGAGFETAPRGGSITRSPNTSSATNSTPSRSSAPARSLHAVNGNTALAPVAAATRPAAPPAAAVDSSAVEFMKVAGRGAIDAVVETEAYARGHGLTDFVFDSLSVQKIMVSLYIDLRKGGRA